MFPVRIVIINIYYWTYVCNWRPFIYIPDEKYPQIRKKIYSKTIDIIVSKYKPRVRNTIFEYISIRVKRYY